MTSSLPMEMLAQRITMFPTRLMESPWLQNNSGEAAPVEDGPNGHFDSNHSKSNGAGRDPRPPLAQENPKKSSKENVLDENPHHPRRSTPQNPKVGTILP